MPVSTGKAGVQQELAKFKAGTLHSGSPKGPIVKSRKQAVAIALSEAGLSKYKGGHPHQDGSGGPDPRRNGGAAGSLTESPVSPIAPKAPVLDVSIINGIRRANKAVIEDAMRPPLYKGGTVLDAVGDKP